MLEMTDNGGIPLDPPFSLREVSPTGTGIPSCILPQGVFLVFFGFFGFGIQLLETPQKLIYQISLP